MMFSDQWLSWSCLEVLLFTRRQEPSCHLTVLHSSSRQGRLVSHAPSFPSSPGSPASLVRCDLGSGERLSRRQRGNGCAGGRRTVNPPPSLPRALQRLLIGAVNKATGSSRARAGRE